MRRPTPPPWVVTSVLAMSGMVAALNLTIVIPLIPVFPALTGASLRDTSWFVTATLLAGAVSIPAAARLADMWGRTRIVVGCLVIVGIGAFLAAIGETYALILAGRTLAGFGMPLVPVGMSVLRDVLPPDRVGRAVALMSATLGIGSALGLPLAGLLHETLGWHTVFWFNGALALAVAAGIVAVVPRSPRSVARERFDVVGAVLLAAATAGAMVVIANGGAWGWASPVSLALIAVSAMLLAAWALWELRTSAPLVDLRVSSSAAIVRTNAASFLVGFGLLINPILAMQQFQAPPGSGYGFGMSVLLASAFMAPGSVLLIAMTDLNGRLLDGWGGRRVLVIGSVVMAIGYVMRSTMWASEWLLLIAVTVTTVGGGLAFAAMPTIIMKSVPSAMTASANGLNALVRQVGTSSSSAVVAAVLASAPILVGGTLHPSLSSIVALDVLAAGACLGAGAVAAFVPRGI